MSKKAPNGVGTVYTDRRGRHCASLWVTLPDGMRKRLCRTTFKTKRDARKWLDETRLAYQSGLPVADSEFTLICWLDFWYRNYSIQGIRDSTRMNYELYIKHVKRHKVKDVLLNKLTTNALQEFIVFLQKSGQLDKPDKMLSEKTIKNIGFSQKIVGKPIPLRSMPYCKKCENIVK